MYLDRHDAPGITAEPLNALLGPIPTRPVGTAYSEPPMRAIVFTDTRGSVAQTIELGNQGHMVVLRAHNHIVRKALAEHGGREVEHTGDGVMAAFGSVPWVQLAARLCGAADAGDIAVSVAVRELCLGKQFTFVERGPVPLKGIPEPVPVYAVAWRD
jgi:adenylate cyclase